MIAHYRAIQIIALTSVTQILTTILHTCFNLTQQAVFRTQVTFPAPRFRLGFVFLINLCKFLIVWLEFLKFTQKLSFVCWQSKSPTIFCRVLTLPSLPLPVVYNKGAIISLRPFTSSTWLPLGLVSPANHQLSAVHYEVTKGQVDKLCWNVSWPIVVWANMFDFWGITNKKCQNRQN